MYLVNNFGRVVDISDETIAKDRLKKGIMREANDAEIAQYIQRKSPPAKSDPNSVFFATVKKSPDGYGMSRDHIKHGLAEQGIEITESLNDQKVGLLYNYPYSLPSLRTDVRLCYTMFEASKIPQEWPELFEHADEVIVPSKWCHDVFLRSGVKTTVVPLGYDDNSFRYIDRRVPIESNEPFTFIHYDAFNMRKGHFEVFKAFTQEFSKDEKVKLILKTIRNTTTIPIVKSQYPNIEVIRGSVSVEELNKILAKAHCMVFPSRGEGFGVTPLEAMATGLPAIVPNAHGISEYFNKNYMLEVDTNGTCPAPYKRFKGQDVGEMIVCDIDSLRKQMRFAFNNQRAMRDLGIAASEYVKAYTYRHTAERLKQIINKWIGADVIKRPDSKYLHVERI